METIELLRAEADRVNTIELQERRAWHAQRVQSGDADDTLDEHIAKFASLARLGDPAGDDVLARLQSMSQVPLPAELLAFYRAAGGFRGGSRLQDAVIHAPADLLRAAALPPGQWDALRSMGLADMILWSWGNDRFEFQPGRPGGMKQASVDALNAGYAIFGWRVMEDGEAFEYLYFDRHGRFGRLFYHQDAFGELVDDDLRPMARESRPAPSDFATAMREFIEAARAPSFPD